MTREKIELSVAHYLEKKGQVSYGPVDPNEFEIYNLFFRPRIEPNFIKSLQEHEEVDHEIS